MTTQYYISHNFILIIYLLCARTVLVCSREKAFHIYKGEERRLVRACYVLFYFGNAYFFLQRRGKKNSEKSSNGLNLAKNFQKKKKKCLALIVFFVLFLSLNENLRNYAVRGWEKLTRSHNLNGNKVYYSWLLLQFTREETQRQSSCTDARMPVKTFHVAVPPFSPLFFTPRFDPSFSPLIPPVMSFRLSSGKQIEKEEIYIRGRGFCLLFLTVLHYSNIRRSHDTPKIYVFQQMNKHYKYSSTFFYKDDLLLFLFSSCFYTVNSKSKFCKKNLDIFDTRFFNSLLRKRIPI